MSFIGSVEHMEMQAEALKYIIESQERFNKKVNYLIVAAILMSISGILLAVSVVVDLTRSLPTGG
jgi:hypothetical protein